MGFWGDGIGIGGRDGGSLLCVVVVVVGEYSVGVDVFVVMGG